MNKKKTTDLCRIKMKIYNIFYKGVYMINKIWVCMLMFSFIFGVFNGQIAEMNNAIFSSLENTTSIIISFIGIMCFWCGMINVLKNTVIMSLLEKILNPFIENFFKKENDNTKKLIMINVVSNMLGIGNAATPSGIKAMKEMDENSSGEAMTYEMNMFVLINTLSIQILPTTIMSMMVSLGKADAYKIILPIWLTSIATFAIVIFMGSIILK